jgi:hypothetical protein
MGKSSRNISDSDSDVSDDLSVDGLSLRVIELENVICNQDKLLCKIIHKNKKLNLELESASSEIASLRSVHDDMSTKPCDNYKMIMVNYADLWLMYSHVASLLDSVKLKLRELKARSKLLGSCTSCPFLRSNLEACTIEIKDLKHQIAHSSRNACGSHKGKLFHATKENIELKQEVTYLTSHLVLSEKMIDEDLSRIEEGAIKSTYKLGVGFDRCEKRVRGVFLSLFLAPTTTKRRKHSNQSKPTTHPIQSHPST